MKGHEADPIADWIARNRESLDEHQYVWSRILWGAWVGFWLLVLVLVLIAI